MNRWTPIAVASVTALAVAIGCGGSSPPPASPGAACNNQPNMAGAIANLREARQWLDKAEHNKGGWRDNAIRSSETAIQETERGCQSADAR